MLGLDVARLAVPDYEVVTRLERLIQNHHATNAGLHPGKKFLNRRKNRLVLPTW